MWILILSLLVVGGRGDKMPIYLTGPQGDGDRTREYAVWDTTNGKNSDEFMWANFKRVKYSFLIDAKPKKIVYWGECNICSSEFGGRDSRINHLISCPAVAEDVKTVARDRKKEVKERAAAKKQLAKQRVTQARQQQDNNNNNNNRSKRRRLNISNNNNNNNNNNALNLASLSQCDISEQMNMNNNNNYMNMNNNRDINYNNNGNINYNNNNNNNNNNSNNNNNNNNNYIPYEQNLSRFMDNDAYSTSEPTPKPEYSWTKTQQQTSNQLFADFIYNSHQSFNLVNNPYFTKWQKYNNPLNQLPSRGVLSGSLLDKTYDNMVKRVNNVVKDPKNGPFCLNYDGGSDRNKSKYHMVVFTNPKPLLWRIGQPSHRGKYSAKDHAKEIKQYEQQAAIINPDIKINGYVMDNENTMKAAQTELLLADPTKEKAGCGSHSLNKYTGDIIKYKPEFCEKLDTLQSAIKNTKIRDAFQDELDEDENSRFGVQDPGDTRWSSRDGQIKKQQSIKAQLYVLQDDEQYVDYINDDVKDIINDRTHWEWMKFISVHISDTKISINYMEGNVGSGIVYYSFLRLFKYIKQEKEKILTDIDFDIDISNVDNVCDELDDDKKEECYKFWDYAQRALLKRWKLSYSDIYIISFFTDIRFIDEKEVISAEYGLNSFYSLLVKRYSNSSISLRGEIRRAFTAFRNKTGIFGEELKFYPERGADTDYTYNIAYWETIKILNNSSPQPDAGVGELLKISIKGAKFSSSNGQTERCMKCIKQIHTKVRNKTGKPKVMKLAYIVNNEKMLVEFEHKTQTKQ